MYSDSEIQSLHSLCRLRSTLEGFAVSLCHENQTLEVLRARLEEVLKPLETAAKSGDYLAFHQADREFHRALMDAAGLEVLEKNWQDVADALDKWVLQVKRDCWPSLMALYRDHTLLVETWTGGDVDIAKDACHHHLEAGWERMAAIQSDAGFSGNDPVDRTVAFLSTHFASHVDMSFVARHVSHTSVANLHRLFHQRVGMPPYAYLRQIRLECAAQLLRSTADSIADVAKRSGYRNLSHFTRDFHRKYGSTPGAFRKAAN